MPEGDTVFKLAAFLQPALSGCRLTGGSLCNDRLADRSVDLSGSEVSDVHARGKHLFIVLDDGHLLRSHLGMRGSWHHYAPDEAWQRPAREASIVLDTGQRVYVCFNALQVELMRESGVRARKFGIVLGPDLLATEMDLDAVIGRVRELGEYEIPIADLLLNQRVACGIGNVYKSETLFIERCHPATPLERLGDEKLRSIYRRAVELLAGNRRGGPRVTRRASDEAGRLWVYGRTGKPCMKCDTPIVSMRLGRVQRSTFWCPRCQPETRRCSVQES